MKTKDRLHVEGLEAAYENKTILKDIQLKVPDGRINVIIGANACGKSTLLKAMSRLLKPVGGVTTLDAKRFIRFLQRSSLERLACFRNHPSYLKELQLRIW